MWLKYKSFCEVKGDKKIYISPPYAYRITATSTFHFTKSGQVSLKDVHLLHQGDESSLCGFSHLLINSFALEKKRDAS